MEYVNPDDIFARFTNPIQTYIRKRTFFRNNSPNIDNIKCKTLIMWVNKAKIPYSESHNLFANMGMGGACLTTSQMAEYCVSNYGEGEYSVIASQKGYMGIIGVFRFTAYKDYWVMYPKDSNKLTSNETLRREYADEFKEIASLKREHSKCSKNADYERCDEIQEEIRDRLEVIEGGREYYDDNYTDDEDKEKYYDHRGVQRIRGYKSKINPWLRNVFPIYTHHCYHPLYEHNIFPKNGRIIEKGGDINGGVDDTINKEDIDDVYNAFEKRRDEVERSKEDQSEDINDLFNEIENKNTEEVGDDMDFVSRRMGT